MTFLDELKKTKLAAVQLFRRRPRDGNTIEPSMSKATLPPIQSTAPRIPVFPAVRPRESPVVFGPSLPPLVDIGKSSRVRGADRKRVKTTRGSDSSDGLVQQKPKALQRKLSLDLPQDESRVSRLMADVSRSNLKPKDIRRIQRKIVVEEELKERRRRAVDKTWPIDDENREENRAGHSLLSKTICEDHSVWAATSEARRAYRDSSIRGDLTERAPGRVVRLPEVKRPKFVPKKESTNPVPPKAQDTTRAAGFVTRKPQPVSARVNRYYFKPDPSLDELLDFDDLPDFSAPKVVSRPVHHRRHDSDPRLRRPCDLIARRKVHHFDTAVSRDLPYCQQRLIPDHRVKLPPVINKAPVRPVPTETCPDDPLEGLDSLLREAERGEVQRRRQTTQSTLDTCDDPLNGLDELLTDVEHIAEARDRKLAASLRSHTPKDVNEEKRSCGSRATWASDDDCTSLSGSVDSCSSLWAQVEEMKKMHKAKRRERKRQQRLLEFGEEEEV